MKINPNYSLLQPISKNNQRCLTCYHSFYYNVTLEQCEPKNPLCKVCDDQNNCLSCYPGYVLHQNNCVINNGKIIPIIVASTSGQFNSGSSSSSSTTSSTNTVKIDVNCRKYDPLTSKCKICAIRYYPDT